MKISNQPVRIEKPKLRIYSKVELKNFGELIQPYYEDYVLQTGPDKGKIIKWLNHPKLSRAFGATNEKDAVVLTGFGSETDSKGSTTYWYDKPTRQEQLENLLEQYYSWRDGQDWANNKKLEQLDEIARSLPEEKTISTADDEFNKW